MEMSSQAIYQVVTDQIRILNDIASDIGMNLHHVKPHGALYNAAASDVEIALAIASAIADFDSRMILYGLANSAFVKASNQTGIKFCAEAFADRTYTNTGLLTPRSEAGAMIENDEEAIAQVLQMLEEGTVQSNLGESISLQPDTICIHGDGPHAVDFAKKIHDALKAKGIQIKTT